MAVAGTPARWEYLLVDNLFVPPSMIAELTATIANVEGHERDTEITAAIRGRHFLTILGMLGAMGWSLVQIVYESHGYPDQMFLKRPAREEPKKLGRRQPMHMKTINPSGR